MSQIMEEPTLEASTTPLPVPPDCTNTEKLWCPKRFMRYGRLVCYAHQLCKANDSTPTVKPPQVWSKRDIERLRLNSHIGLKALQWLLEDYTEEEIRVKLEELEE